MNEEAVGEPEARSQCIASYDSQFVLSFDLRPQYLAGLLFPVASEKTSLNVFLMENKVN